VLFKTLYVGSASNSRLTADFLSVARYVNFDSAEPRRICIRRFCVFYPTIGLVLYLTFRDPKALVIFGGFFQAATIPVLAAAAVYMRYRRTDRRLSPSVLSDACLWFALVSISVVSAYALWDWALHQLWPAVSGAVAGTHVP
jgi:manganese transport protein